MTNNQFRAALAALQLTQLEAAEWLGVSLRSVNGYAADKPIPEPVAKLLRLVVRLKLDPSEVR